MGKIPFDRMVGMRAYEEVQRIGGHRGAAALMRKMDIDYKRLTCWKSGTCPNALDLAKLHDAGADVMFILTGRRR